MSMFFAWMKGSYGQQKVCFRIDIAEGIEMQDSISLTLWHHFTYVGSRYESENHHILPTSSKPVEFTVSQPDFSTRILLVNSNWGVLVPFVPLEPCDSVIMHINTTNGKEVDMVFSGSGSSKYSFLHKFEKDKKKISPLWRKLSQYAEPVELLDDIERIINESLTLLDEYRVDLSDSAYCILKTDVIGHFNQLQLMLAATGYADSEGFRKRKYERILVDLLKSDSLIYAPEILSVSKEYIEYLYTKTKIALVYQYKPAFSITDLRLKAPYSFVEQYQALKKQYEGRLRDQVLAYYLVNSAEMVRYFGGVDPLEFQQCLDDALLTIGNSAMLRLIAHERRAASVGEKAYDFELPDVEGKKVRLSDFNGKVVLIDFWGNGCGGCLTFKKKFEEMIYPHVKDNPNFVFVSINIDKSRDTWLKALPLYSRQDFVNLSLYGMGSKHEVYKHYSIKGLPTILLVDRQGHLVSSTLPRNMDELYERINKELAQFRKDVE